MGIVDREITKERFWVSLFMAGLIAGLVLRFYLASFAKMPGHGDSAFYYTVAKNIASGRGPVIDYVVYFFNGLPPLPHYAGDFWNPSASYLITIPMILFGRTISNALIASIIAGVGPALAGYLAGKYYSHSIAIGALTGILTFFSPFQVWFSVTTEAIIFAGAFGALAIYLMMRGLDKPRFFLLAAVCTGIAHLIRQDDILLLPTLMFCILIAPAARKNKLKVAGAALGIHLLILSPLLVQNFKEFHAPFPAGPAQSVFLTTYEDFHSYGKELDWKTLRATWGITGIIAHRLHTAGENLGQVNYFLTPILTILLLISMGDAVFFHRNRSKLRLLIPALLFAVLEFIFYSAIASFSGPGSLIKSLGILLPFICLLIVEFFANFSGSQAGLIAAVVVLSGFSGFQGFQKNYSSTIYYNEMYEKYRLVEAIIQKDAVSKGIASSDVTVMARDTWDVNEGTGFKTVMVPNNDLDTIVFVARHYNVHYILLPVPPRPRLDLIYSGQASDPRFGYLASIPNSDIKIFWIDFSK
jgi:4-amino-4-deoxy-L-arabinose transferase-like glycosyltransferase